MQAAIDIGSNTVRLLIGEVVAGSVNVHSQALLTTRLGNTRVGDRLSSEGRAKTIEALRQFKQQIAAAGVKQPPVVAATSAVREASDGADFQQEIWQQLGWRLQILSGDVEAACSYTGAASVLKQLTGAADGQPVIIDVGGGSTELISQQPDGTIFGKSVKVGAVRLFNGEVAQENLRPMLAELLTVLPVVDRPYRFVSVGGTITLVAALLAGIEVYDRSAVSGRRVSRAEIERLCADLQPLTPAERLQKYPLLQGREDIILAGLNIYLTLADLLGAAEFIASDAGLLDGLLLRDAN
ncbi:MAG: hypothetical protein OSJ64_01350 [Firmicutes bacterium]|nr:hypothetical protein [Bacillota bacterium]